MRFALVLLGLAMLAQAETPTARFDRLMRELIIVDTHIDTPGYIVDEGYRLSEEHPYYELDIPRMRRGGMGAVFFGVYVEPQAYPPAVWLPRSLEWIDAVHEEVRRNPKDLEMAYSADDIERIHRAGRMAVLLGLEGGHMIQDSLALLRDYYRLGVRYMTLTHFQNNNWADSSTDKPVHNGLTAFGRGVVREMNRIGMIVDISHVADKTFYDALEVSRAPIIASHSSLRAFCDIPRNMDDDMVKALARKSGVIFINFNTAYLDRKAYDVFAANQESREREIKAAGPGHWEAKREILQRYRKKLPPVPASAVLREIDHVVKIAGADHVGLGSDFDGISGMVPVGLEDVSKYPVLVRGMIDMGYSDGDIRKIMGGNLLRVMRAVEGAAEK